MLQIIARNVDLLKYLHYQEQPVLMIALLN